MTRVYVDSRGVRYVAAYQPAPPSFKDAATCGDCHRTWDDAIPTSVTPAPSARCPFEHWHNREHHDNPKGTPMTTLEQPTTTTTAALVDPTTLRAIAVAASTDKVRVMLTAVAFTIRDTPARDRWELQATDSYCAAWTGAVPADSGHFLVDGKALTAALRSLGVKRDLVAVSFTRDNRGRGDCTVTGPNGTMTLPLIDGEFPRLDRLTMTNTSATETIGFTDHTMGRVCAVAKLVGSGFKLTLDGPNKPCRVTFPGSDVSMIVMPYKVAA